MYTKSVIGNRWSVLSNRLPITENRLKQMSDKNPSPIERIKKESHSLRGTIADGLKDEITGAISEDDQAVIKFHGMYQQDDRDLREERAVQKLERLYSFMIACELPGGFLKPEQWIATDEIAGANSTGVIKITSRQTIQLHGLIKSKLKPTIQSFNNALLDSIATCGDINRNVLCSSHPKQSPIHEQVFAYADKISTMLMPKTRAYYEIWLDEEKLLDKKEEEDPCIWTGTCRESLRLPLPSHPITMSMCLPMTLV